MKSFSGVLIHF